MPLMLIGADEEGYTSGSLAGMPYWTGISEITVTLAEPAALTVKVQEYGSTDATVAKEYTATELAKLVDPSADAIAGQYIKNGVAVWASSDYVTLDALFEDAGVEWGEGATASWGAGSKVTTKSYADLNDRYFYPAASVDAEGNYTYSTDGAVKTPAAVALTAGRKFVGTSEGNYSNAADAKAAALADQSTESTPLMIIGADEEGYTSGSLAGMPFWTGLSEITVTLACTHANAVETPAKDATCTEAGNTAYWTCSVCGKYFSDAACTNEIEKDSWIIPVLEPETIPVYRMYNPATSEHLWTTDRNEYNKLAAEQGWTQEGVGWQSLAAEADGAVGVYRLYNAALGVHHYTTSQREITELTTNQGWTLDNKGKPLFYAYDKNDTRGAEVYRLYNEGLSQHHLTMKASERNKLVADFGWKDEAIAFRVPVEE